MSWDTFKRAIHWKTFFGIQILIWFMATLGLWVGSAVPFLGTLFFIAGLMVWYGVGIALMWTGAFEFHEFGASPTGPLGYMLMFLLIALIALLIAFGIQRLISRRRRKRGL